MEAPEEDVQQSLATPPEISAYFKERRAKKTKAEPVEESPKPELSPREQRFRIRSCLRKKRYYKQKAASIALTKLLLFEMSKQSDNVSTLHIYNCGFCGHMHIGHASTHEEEDERSRTEDFGALELSHSL